MREIKFDAIYKPTGEHFEPKELDFRQNHVVGDFDGKKNDWCHFSLDGKYGDVILRQYTGLKDKNGKEIYEGDILKMFSSNYILCEVIFQAPSFCRKWITETPKRVREHEIEPLEPNTGIVYEVIGNIYENPELLEA